MLPMLLPPACVAPASSVDADSRRVFRAVPVGSRGTSNSALRAVAKVHEEGSLQWLGPSVTRHMSRWGAVKVSSKLPSEPPALHEKARVRPASEEGQAFSGVASHRGLPMRTREGMRATAVAACIA